MKAAFDPGVVSGLASLPLRARYLVEGFLTGIHASPYRGFSVEFSEYRDYQPGDDPRHLDWRLYGRSDRLCIREFEEETNVRAYLVVDASGSMGYGGEGAWDSKLGCAKALAAALGWLLLRQKDAAGLLTTGGNGGLRSVPPGQRSSQLGLLLRELGGLEAGGEGGLGFLLSGANRLIHRRSLVAIFSDFLEGVDVVADRVKELRFNGHDCFVFQILDRDEIDFPFTEAAVFEDPETGMLRHVTPERARAKYLERFEAFMAPQRELFRKLAIPHEVIRTDAEPYAAMARFLAARGRLR